MGDKNNIMADDCGEVALYIPFYQWHIHVEKKKIMKIYNVKSEYWDETTVRVV